MKIFYVDIFLTQILNLLTMSLPNFFFPMEDPSKGLKLLKKLLFIHITHQKVKLYIKCITRLIFKAFNEIFYFFLFKKFFPVKIQLIFNPI